MSLIGVYWSVMHRRLSDYSYFKRLQPSVFKIMDGGQPDYQWARENLPNSLILARDWALSEQHSDMLADPVGTGTRHAQEWNRHQQRLGFDKAKTLILGINEPQVWMPGVAEALRKYTLALCEEAAKLGLRVGAMQFSVGWPGNSGPDTPPNWSAFEGVEQVIRNGNHALVTHEYWADNGPNENWGWWAGRTLKCPWNVPIVIGECGVDMYVKVGGQVPHNARGWQGRMDANRYAAELAEYVGKMSADKRFLGACVFASDFANREWFSFDIEPAYEAILAAKVATATPVETRLPIVGGGVSQSSSIIDPLVAEAILQIESGGRAFGNDGKLLIRFEAHIFRQYLGNDGLFNQFFAHSHSKPWENQTFNGNQIHTGSQASEYAAFEFAKTLNANAAYMAISMGSAQIMGFNHAGVGYVSAQAMYQSFSRSEQAQTIAFINFCLNNPALSKAIQQRDWDNIARYYNGAGNVGVYGPLLRQAYEKLTNA